MTLSKATKNCLVQSGWKPGRNIYSELSFLKKVEILESAKVIYSEFGLLKLFFDGRSGKEALFFDVDDSEAVKNIRANIYGFESYNDEGIQSIDDFSLEADFELTEVIGRSIGEPCNYIGFHEENLGMDLFVTADGSIYAAHGEQVDKQASSIYEYLNLYVIA